MTNKRNLNVAKWLVGGALVLVGSSAMADWNFGSGSLTATGSTITATASGVSTTGTSSSGATFATAAATAYATSNGLTYGIGVSSATDPTGSPDHSTDNVGSTDAVLLSFSSSVVLTGITSGWTWKNDTLTQNSSETTAQFNDRKALQAASDSDISVLRYIGTVPAYTSAASAAAAAVASTVGKTVSQLTAAGGGWALVSQLADVVSDTSTATGATQGSSWWLISAYNSGYAATGSTTPTNLDNGNDYFKLLAVAGVATPTSTTKVPEPGSLALMGAGLLGLLASRRKAKGNTVDLAA